MWKGFETYSQISFRNIFLVSLDWIRTKIFGRDISRVNHMYPLCELLSMSFFNCTVWCM